jgi:hypothetical protein
LILKLIGDGIITMRGRAIAGRYDQKANSKAIVDAVLDLQFVKFAISTIKFAESLVQDLSLFL